MGITELIGRSAESAYAFSFLKSVYNDEWPSFSSTDGFLLSDAPCVCVCLSLGGRKKLFSSRAGWLGDVGGGLSGG